MDYYIAIPSYQRAGILNSKTLQTLQRYQIDKKHITIFVANAEEEQSYLKICDKNLYDKIVIGQKGIMAIRNFITNYYPEGAYVISIDDDIDGYDKATSAPKSTYTPIASFKEELIDAGRKLMEDNKYHIWGIYPYRNAGYATKMNEISLNLKFLIGHTFGFINKKIYTHINYKEDYERSIEYALLDGGVVRFNHISAKTKFGIAGGVNKTAKERNEVYHKETDYLIQKYPLLVRRNRQRDGEILLAQKPKKS